MVWRIHFAARLGKCLDHVLWAVILLHPKPHSASQCRVGVQHGAAQLALGGRADDGA